jgi:hypothetical protein
VKKFRTDSWLTAVAVILTAAPALAEPVAIVTRVNGHVSARYRSAPAASSLSDHRHALYLVKRITLAIIAPRHPDNKNYFVFD